MRITPVHYVRCLDVIAKVAESLLTVLFWMTVFSLFSVTRAWSLWVYHAFNGRGEPTFEYYLALSICAFVLVVTLRTNEAFFRARYNIPK